MQISLLLLWSVWGVLVLVFAVLKLYASRLRRDEDDQLVLDDAFAKVKEEQAAIRAGLSKVEPIERTVMWLLIAMTLVVVGYYVADAVRQFQ